MSEYDGMCARCKFCNLQFRYQTMQGTLFLCKKNPKLVKARQNACNEYVMAKSRKEAYIVEREGQPLGE